jgi:UDP-4-amino-4,6-dideoxy-N-acetyl-beta-L-altrosamine transaminase
MDQALPLLPYGRQQIDEDDIAAVVAVLRGELLTQGPEVERFEAALAEVCGARHAVALSHGTAALFAAAAAAGVGPGDEVITSAVTFAASANCAAFLGAQPVLVDVRPDTATLDVAAVERAITPRTRAIVPVDFAGLPADLDEVAALARRHGLAVIRDAAHSLGATYRGERTGGSARADLTMLSFHPVKHITTGEGGAVLTDDADLARRLRRFRSHGIERDPTRFEVQPAPGAWYHEMQELGHNLRLTDLQAALGRSQLARLDHFVARRRALALAYDAGLASLPAVRPLGALPDREHSYHLYVVRIDFAGLGLSRAIVMQRLRDLGIGTQVHYIPVYRHPYHQRQLASAGLPHRPEDFPAAEAYYAEALSLPLFPGMGDDDVPRVIDALAAALRT